MKINKRVAPSELSQDLLHRQLAYDYVTGIFTWKYRPAYCVRVGSAAGTNHKTGYIRIRMMRSCYFAHRLAWFYVHGVWPTEFIDHIDGNPSNNSIGNLREANAFQNQHNSPSLGFCWSERDKRFSASIRINHKIKWLGNFKSASDARSAYLAAHSQLAGEYSFTRRSADRQACAVEVEA